jgi:hypothetical protein
MKLRSYSSFVKFWKYGTCEFGQEK